MRRNTPRRRGAVAVAMIVLLIIVDLLILTIVLGGGRDQDLTVRRLETIRSFYAAEAGINMATREVMRWTDEDGDGAVGTISDDGNAANDPQISFASFFVSSSTVTTDTTLTSTGTSGEAARKLEMVVSDPPV